MSDFKFNEAIQFYRNKIKLPTSGWTDLWQEQHSHAFVVAGAAQDALVEDFFNAIQQAKWGKDGGGYEGFKKTFPEIAAKHGWSYNGAPGWRSRVIYDTNITQAYNAGRYQQMVAVKEFRPYWQYRHTSIEHPRLTHKAWDSLILPADDPWWNSHFPQNGWGCKCRVDSLSRAEAEPLWKAKGNQGPDNAPPIEWEDKLVGKNGSNPRVVRTPKGIDPGFAYNPGKAWLEPHIVPPLPEHLARLVPDEWPWPKGYKPPTAPIPTPVSKALLHDDVVPPTSVVTEFLSEFGATLTTPVVFMDERIDAAIVIGSKMFIAGGAAYDESLGDEQFKMMMEGKGGRKKYMRLLAQSIKDPDEIWQSWETIKKNPAFEGQKIQVSHYLKAFVFADADGAERYMIAIFRKSRLGWDAVTTFHSSKENYFESKRRGFLAYKKK